MSGDMIDFKPFKKIARYNRDIVITEKIDGTNACVVITALYDPNIVLGSSGGLHLYAQSRNRFIFPGKEDNHGFAQFVKDNHEELSLLGEGYHFGEWWGNGIQRGYGISNKKFTLFNHFRWEPIVNIIPHALPSCCSVVPVIYRGPHNEPGIKRTMMNLKILGSVVSPGYDKPEGIVINHVHSGALFKITFENDDVPKSTVV